MQSTAPVGPHLADQLMLPLGISAWLSGRTGLPGGGSFRTLPLTLHSTTHIEVLRAFLDIDIQVEDSDDGESSCIHLRGEKTLPNARIVT